MIWLLPHLSPLLPSASCLSFSVYLCVELIDGRGERVEGGAESYKREKARRSSINHSILSAQADDPFAVIGFFLPLPPSAHTATLPFTLFLNLLELEFCIYTV
jgi:hypothetical protein